MEEIFKPINGFRRLYAISNLGRVKSLKRDKIIAPSIVGGFMHVILKKKGTQKGMYIHRLLAEAFLPNPNNLSYVKHKDKNKLNNNLSNLEWCSLSDLRKFNRNRF